MNQTVETGVTGPGVQTHYVELVNPSPAPTPNVDHALARFGANGFIQALRRETIQDVLWVLERGSNIMNARAIRDANLTEDQARRLRAIRDELADYDRLRLLYVDPDAPAVEDSAA